MSAIAAHKAAWATAKARQVGTGGFTAVPDVTTKAGREDALMLAACKMDWDRLKTIPDHAERNKLKPALLVKYRDYLRAWVAEEVSHPRQRVPVQNDVLVRNLVWAVDANDWDYALSLAADCVVTKQVMTMMERTPATFFTDSVVQAIEKLQFEPGAKLKRVAHAIREYVEADVWAVAHVAVAKLYRALAKIEKDQNPAEALRYAQKAHSLFPNVAVKGLIESLTKQVETLSSGSGAPARVSSGGLSVVPPPQDSGNVAGESGSPLVIATAPVADTGNPVFLSDA
jgi:hypothetical protein